MNINSLKFLNTNKIGFKGIEGSTPSSNPIKSTPDVFIKTTQATQTKKEYTLEDITKLYKSVLLESLVIHHKINPILKGVKLNIPKVEIDPTKEETDFASYTFATNTISISKKLLNEDFYVLYVENQDKKDTTTLGITPSENLEKEIEALKKLGIEAKAIKLNEKEKEFFIASSLAHETRHFFQAHLIASAEGISEKYKKEQVDATEAANKAIAGLNSIKQEIFQEIEIAKRDGYPIPPSLLELAETNVPISYIDATYVKNYQPNNLLSQNTMFKFSIFPQDKRAMTINDLYNASKEKANINSSRSYFANLTEIDAFNYGYEYALTARNRYLEGSRKFVIDAICMESYKNASNGIQYSKDDKNLPSTMS